MDVEKLIQQKQKELEEFEQNMSLGKMTLGDFYIAAQQRESLVQQIAHLQRYVELAGGNQDE